MQIHFIYADECDSCKKMREIILSAKKHKIIELIEMECETDEAVDYAINNGINDLPACHINGIIIQGENFDERELVRQLTK